MKDGEPDPESWDPGKNRQPESGRPCFVHSSQRSLQASFQILGSLQMPSMGFTVLSNTLKSYTSVQLL